MKIKVTLLVAIVLCVTSLGFAQGQLPMQTYQAQYDSLQPHISTSGLMDRNPQHLIAGLGSYHPLQYHPDSAKSCTLRNYRNLWEMMYYATYDSTLFSVRPKNWEKAVDSSLYGQIVDFTNTTAALNAQPQAEVMLGILHWEYDYITREAFDSGYVRYDTVDSRYYLNAGTIHISDTVFLDTATMDPNNIILIDTTYYVDPDSAKSKTFAKTQMVAFGKLMDEIACIQSLSTPVRIKLPERFSVKYPGYSYYIDFDDGNGCTDHPNRL